MAIIRINCKLTQLAFRNAKSRKHNAVRTHARFTKLARHYAKLQTICVEPGYTDTFKAMRLNGRADTVYQRNFFNHRKDVYTLKVRKILACKNIRGKARTPFTAKVYPSFI
jgi:hypothetical protein